MVVVEAEMSGVMRVWPSFLALVLLGSCPVPLPSKSSTQLDTGLRRNRRFTFNIQTHSNRTTTQSMDNCIRPDLAACQTQGRVGITSLGRWTATLHTFSFIAFESGGR